MRKCGKKELQIRVPGTALGTLWVECFRAGTLYITSSHRGCRWLDGQKLPFFRVELTQVKDRWTIADFYTSTASDAPKWPRGARAKVPSIVLEIGAAWAAENDKAMREHQVAWLRWEVSAVKKGLAVNQEANLGLIRKAIAHATILNRLDLLRPAQPIIQSIAGEFSRAKRWLSAQRRRTRIAA